MVRIAPTLIVRSLGLCKGFDKEWDRVRPGLLQPAGRPAGLSLPLLRPRFSWMSKAFTREDDSDGATELPERIISPHPNLVTPEGRARIDAQIADAGRRQAEAVVSGDKDVAVRAARDLRYWRQRSSTAQVQPQPPGADEVAFGSTVELVLADGRRVNWRIVGEDEADPATGTLSHASPLARALMGQGVGDSVSAGATEAAIVAIRV